MNTLKAVFDYHFRDTKFDQTFVNKVDEFIRMFLTKNDDHVDFFGGNLLGVHTVRWNYSDTDYWWDEIFEVIPDFIQKDMNKLSDIKSQRIVSSDVLNHALVYSIHRVHHSTSISDNDREMTKVKLMIALNMKFLCSLMAHYFKYPADRGVAEKTFNRLTKRYDIKVLGSWGKVINQRSADYVSSKGRYYKAYVDYRPDIEIIKMINDAQGRIRETVKAITAEFYKCLNENARILSSSSSLELDGKVVLKDLQRKPVQYSRYIKTILSTGDNYRKEEIDHVIYSAINSLNPDWFEKFQTTLVKQWHDRKYTKHFESMVDNLLTYSFELLTHANISERDLPAVVQRLKHSYMSGRVQDESLNNARKSFTYLVEATDKKMKNTPFIPERCGVFLYIVLRTLTMHYYK